MIWETWKKGFDAWESATAKYLEVVLSSPLVLEPAGKMLTAAAKAKVAQDDFWSNAWHAVGLPSRRDQQRLMHAVNQLSSSVLDVEESLADAPRAPRARRGSEGQRPSAASRPARGAVTAGGGKAKPGSGAQAPEGQDESRS